MSCVNRVNLCASDVSNHAEILQGVIVPALTQPQCLPELAPADRHVPGDGPRDAAPALPSGFAQRPQVRCVLSCARCAFDSDTGCNITSQVYAVQAPACSCATSDALSGFLP